MVAPTVGTQFNPAAPSAAAAFATAWAKDLVEVEAACLGEGCEPTCQVRRAVAGVAISAAGLAREWATVTDVSHVSLAGGTRGGTR